MEDVSSNIKNKSVNPTIEITPAAQKKIRLDQNQIKKRIIYIVVILLFTLPIILYPFVWILSTAQLEDIQSSNSGKFISSIFWYLILLYPIPCTISWILMKKNKLLYSFLPLFHIIFIILYFAFLS